jgi:Zn-dependent M28 family amino/carboxypeptidase
VARAAAIFKLAGVLGTVVLLCACGGSPAASGQAPAGAARPQDAAPPAAATGGFDGARAFQHVASLVAIGPHSAGSEGGRRAQEYISGQLQGFGCTVEQMPFNASTPIGAASMKNIVAKIPGASPDIVMFATHYDSKRIPNFVGADDGGSSSGVMLELARLLCARKNALTVWIAFFDGEEAFNENWVDPDNTYGSREMAARMKLSGELERVRALVLADLVGNHNLRLKRESQSTEWLTDLIWATAARLGYQRTFVDESTPIEDDHLPFLRRGVAAADIIDLENPQNDSYWHQPSDTLDKVSPRSLATVGHVLIEVLPQLESKFVPAANH